MQTVGIPMSKLAELLRLQISEGGLAPLTVTGYSMMPMLKNRRDQVWLTGLDGAVEAGDIILYRRANGQYVLHRVMAVGEGTGCLCCGDNDWETEQVAQADIAGVVCRFCRKGKIYTVRDWRYRLYVRVWMGLFPLRKPILHVRRKLGRLRRALKEKR